jgi:hypothetical protein
LLRQIAFEEPTRLRRLARAIPAELETVVLKAMEKRPQDRYATAQELADDLRHWLNNEPIRARRPGLVQRITKWGRRHRPLVFAAVVSMLLALFLLAISNLVIWYEHQTTKEALLKARIHEQEINHLVDREVRLREAFEGKLQRSLEAMDSLFTTLDESFPEEKADSARIRQPVSEQAVRFYCDLLPIETHRRLLVRETMWAYVRLGNLYALRNQFAEAKQAYHSAAEAMSQWVQLAHPEETAGEPELPRISAAGDIEDHPATQRAYRRALMHWRNASPKELADVEDFRERLVQDLTAREIRAPRDRSPRDKKEFNRKVFELRKHVLEDLPTMQRVSEVLKRALPYGRDLQEVDQVEDAKTTYRQAIRQAERGIAQDLMRKEIRIL